MKKCKKCKQNKEISFFHKDITTKDGHRSACKDCRKLYDNANWKRWRTNNPDKFKALQRVSQKAYRDRYPEKQQARILARKSKKTIKNVFLGKGNCTCTIQIIASHYL